MNFLAALARLRAGSVERWLELVMAAALVVPLLILAVFAWHAYGEAAARASQRVEHTTRIAREHALKAFETNDLVLRRVFDLLRDDSDEALTEREAELHSRLAEMVEALREVKAIAVWSADGRVIAHSRVHPVPTGLTILDRDYFQAARGQPRGTVISDTVEGGVIDGVFFVVGRRRDDARGEFAGMVTVALSPSYFTAFYEQLAAGDAGLSIAIARPDGAVLTRFPNAPAPGVRMVAHDPLIPLIGDAEPTPASIAVSPEDGRRRYVNAQRIGNHPLFLTTDYLHSAVVDEWRGSLGVPALVAALAAAALLLATWMALRKTRREQQAVAQTQAEAARRAAAERMLSHLSQHLIGVSETEKAKLAAELHDELGGALSALALDLAWVLERLKKKAPELVDRQNQAIKLVHDTAALKRRIIDGLRPMLLQHLGLGPALRDYVTQWSRKTGIPVELQLPGEPTLSSDAALALFRVAQESLTNAAKYASATKITVSLLQDPQGVTLEVVDDGVGIAPEILEHPTSHGLTGMRQRVAPFGGRFDVHSELGKGTRITARLPLAGDATPISAVEINADA